MLKVQPVTTAGGAAARYVPFVVLTRVLAAARFLLVAWLLQRGVAGGQAADAAGVEGAAKAVYGTYQLALELINWCVPIMLFGLADMVERYAARFEHEKRLAGFFKRQAGRLLLSAAVIMGIAGAAAPWLGRVAFGEKVPAASPTVLILLVAGNVAVLGFYQWTAAALRGVRAYGAAAGLETIAAVTLLTLSCVAALGGSPVWLLAAYALSNMLPLAWYILELGRFARTHEAPQMPGAGAEPWPRLDVFARWTLLRLLLTMTFGLVAIGGVGWTALPKDAKEEMAEFAMPYRIAQMLGFLAVTLWASTYGISTRAWARGQKRRARVVLLRTGRIGGTLLLLGAGAGLLTLDMIALLVPAGYRSTLVFLLPGMLAMFVWYGLLAFYAMLADLEERPQVGALLWGAAVVLQVGALLLIPHGRLGAREIALIASAGGVGVAVIVVAPLMFWRPVRFSAAAVPMGIFAFVPLAFFVPWGMAWWVGASAVAGAVLFLWGAGLLVRPRDKRAMRRMAARRKAGGSVAP